MGRGERVAGLYTNNKSLENEINKYKYLCVCVIYKGTKTMKCPGVKLMKDVYTSSESYKTTALRT